ncbi:sulfurtransferase [Photobacterium japonica]|uniref:sulfurtransferase n=1 Tax=Photobacterium japonica TaxID=2910235 RepID=UPI003D0A3F41
MRITNYGLLSLLALFSASLWATTFDQLAKHPSSDIQIIDCRNSNAFNGWPETGQTRGGHFPGAINFDADWLSTLRPPELGGLLESRGIVLDHPTFLYCAPQKAQMLKDQLTRLGNKRVTVMPESLSAYSGDLVSLPRFQHLVPADWLDQLIRGEAVPHAPKNGFKVVEVAWGPPTKYLVAHIPSSLYVNTNNLEAEPWWNHVDAKQLTDLVRDLGIRHDTTVILYGRDNTAAARAAHILMYAGVDDVRLLNGGWTAWTNAGFETEALLNQAEPVDFGRTIPANPQYMTDLSQARDMLKHPDNQSLVSIRSWAEYTGETSGYRYIKPKGRIVGSKWGHAGSDAYHLEHFRNPDNTMLSADVITQFWDDWDIHANQHVAFYCGTGWRASEVFFYAYVMGWQHISVFDGGWFEWSGDANNPTETGDIPNAPKAKHY